MVSGHTIRKPTINLSRINMEHINNSTRLSNIQEVPTPTRNQEIDETASSISLSIPITQMRYVCVILWSHLNNIGKSL